MLPNNIITLAERNEALLEKINFTPCDDNPIDLCKPEAYLATGLFTDDQVDNIFSSANRDPQTQVRNIGAELSQRVGMILIRPDMLHESSTFENLLHQRFTLLHTEDVIMTSEAYWGIYSHDMYRTDIMHTRLTRAAMYIGSTCKLIIYADLSEGNYNVADFSRNTLRGNQGVYDPGTLRGEIVYNAGLALGLHTLEDDIVARAVDPFRAYRDMAARPDGAHSSLRYPLLFYTGVGVHVPDGIEITNDLPMLTGFRPNQTVISESRL